LPVRLTRLRIAGFKSFAEPVSLDIRPGLTGIVGPNGCGKSNVVEALRWAMGEASAKSLRGGEMDDVIFAGTAHRASRNIAEVSLSLDETQGAAPPPFHDQPELEVIRRIERGSGSCYKVNGREARARDVQTLFADLASGAGSSAMVGQGRVGAIVNARPEARRSIIEEAAGISGLHARRHEAELKLRAAEANLARAEDTRLQLENQLAGLRRQAKQASRYRNIAGAVRAAEAELLALQKARAETLRAAARTALHDAGVAAAEAAGVATRSSARATDAASLLPALRTAEGEIRTGLERAKIAREQIAAEEQRARAALHAAAARHAQLDRDHAHAMQTVADARSARTRLEQEAGRLAEAGAGHESRLSAAEAALHEAEAAALAADQAANRAVEAAAEAGARRHAATQVLAQAEQRQKRVAGQLAGVEAERARAAAQCVASERVEGARAEAAAADGALEAAGAGLDAAEREGQAAQAALASARERLAAAESAFAKPAAEARALAEVLGVRDGERWPPMIDALVVPDGLEAALGAALGAELTSAGDRAAARHWRELPPLQAPSLPDGAVPLASLVQGPPALDRALSQIGLAEDGDAAQASLAPGQMLVSRGGAVWRWDGYTVLAGTPTEAAVRLRQRNSLAELRRVVAVAERDAVAAREACAQAQDSASRAAAAEQVSRENRRAAGQRAERARAEFSRVAAQADQAAARLAAVEQQLVRLRPEAAEAEAALAEAREGFSKLSDVSELRRGVESARSVLAEARGAEASARAARDGLAREQLARAQRLAAIGPEAAEWASRSQDADRRLAELAARREAAAADHDQLAAAPAAAAARGAAAVDALEAAEAAHRSAAEALAAAMADAEAAARDARAAETRLSAAREAVLRAEGGLAQAEQAFGAVAERVAERLGDAPLPDPPAEVGAESEERARRRLERLQRERDEMGPVNLRAEVEAAEVEARAAAIETERAELGSAIAKLRGSIGHLNREGRARITEVFEQADRHFQALFARMFGGGRAHLALVGSDDVLEAGLEIYAQPPGKKLSALSLLSGGEQALTALSLIFAVFRCNPAPVCVLDEVDAPLDDANVERFCALIEDMARETGTRFLVVTHHAMTMARMDRLYGVTMQERGVSRLLSVDLGQAERMVEQPRIAAE
jgi:chromosome segregation protein